MRSVFDTEHRRAFVDYSETMQRDTRALYHELVFAAVFSTSAKDLAVVFRTTPSQIIGEMVVSQHRTHRTAVILRSALRGVWSRMSQ